MVWNPGVQTDVLQGLYPTVNNSAGIMSPASPNFVQPFAAEPGGGGFWKGLDNIFGEYGNVIGGGMNVLGGLSSIYGMFKNLGLAEDAFEHRKTMDLKNYAAQRQMYANHLEDRWKINSGFMRSRGKDPTCEFGTLAQYTADRQIPA